MFYSPQLVSVILRYHYLDCQLLVHLTCHTLDVPCQLHILLHMFKHYYVIKEKNIKDDLFHTHLTVKCEMNRL